MYRTGLFLIAAASVIACSGSSGASIGERPATPAASGEPDASPPGPPVVAPELSDCAADVATSPSSIEDRCGVFVVPFAVGGDDAAPGLKAAPVATIKKGIETARALRKPRVFVCSATYEEQLEIGASLDGVSLTGGLVCPSKDAPDAFAPTTERAVIKAPAGSSGPAVIVSDIRRPITLEHLEVRASAAGPSGASSVALSVLRSASVLLRDVRLMAANGASGANGISGAPGQVVSTAPRGSLIGAPPLRSLPDFSIECACNSGATTWGGYGAGITEDGASYQPGAAGGIGRIGKGGADGRPGACDAEGAGSAGKSGASGRHADAATVLGSLSANGEWTPASGVDGQNGESGGAGGGGNVPASGYADRSSGGAGGCGGCGGLAGKGGQGGGASIALIAVNSKVAVVGGELIAAAAGAGGRGAAGGEGVSGNPGNAGIANGCGGGAGGIGGAGASGSGGAGGLSAAVLASTDADIELDASTRAHSVVGTPGAAGQGGRPGVNDGPSPKATLILKAP